MKFEPILSILTNVFIMIMVWWNFGFVYVLWLIGMMVVVFIIVMTVLMIIFKRQATMEKQDFYDDIWAYCGLPSIEAGRDLDAVNIKWEKGKITNIEVKLPHAVPTISEFASASIHIKNTIAWRYELTDEQIAFSFSRLHEGIIEAILLTSNTPEDTVKFAELSYIEGLHRLAYFIPSSLQDKIQAVEVAGVGHAGTGYMFDLLTITCDKPFSEESAEKFKTDFARKYPDAHVTWALSQEGRRIEAKRVGSTS